MLTNYPCKVCGVDTGKEWGVDMGGYYLCEKHYYEHHGKVKPETISVAEYKEMCSEGENGNIQRSQV